LGHHIGHISEITSLIFPSPSTLISASDDQSVKFWQIGDPPIDPAGNPTSISSISSPVTFVRLQATNGIAISGHSGNVQVQDISTGLYQAKPSSPYMCYTQSDVQMIDGKLVCVWLEVEGIKIWDKYEGEHLLKVEVDWSLCRGLRISEDGSKVFCIIGNILYAWSMWKGEAIGEVELGGGSSLASICASG
jgi:WD40 repeat protein